MAEAHPGDNPSGYSGAFPDSNAELSVNDNKNSQQKAASPTDINVTLRAEVVARSGVDEEPEMEKLQSPLTAKVVASVVMATCWFFIGFAAYREAVLASKISDPWMRGLRMRNSYVISAAGVFLGVCLWALTIWLLNTYINA